MRQTQFGTPSFTAHREEVYRHRRRGQIARTAEDGVPPRLHSPSSTLRTRVTEFFVSAALSVFGWSGIKLGAMRGSTPARLGRFCLWLTFDFLLAAGLLAITAWGDTSAKSHQRTASSCYCGCAMSKTATGCAKMCDLPKFASRHWAVTCTKVHTAAPAESPNAQPHLPHYSRSERASN